MRSRLIGLLVIVIGALAALPAHAAWTSVPPIPAATNYAAALHRAEIASELLDDTGLATAIRNAAALVNVAIEEPSVAPGTPVGGGPVGLRDSLDRLVAAVDAAAQASADSLRIQPGSILDATERLLRPGGLEGEHSSASRFVDRRALYSAALSLATEIDRQLPTLRLYAREAVTGGASEECDLIDAIPALCVGGTGDNTYSTDTALLVDLGGDDVYNNSAGGADPLANGLGASVNIDLEGDDTYEADVTGDNGAGSVQGAGSVGGIGILLDESGDDSYSITNRDATTGTTSPSGAFGQGVGYLGVGILQDVSGSDTYRVIDRSPAGLTHLDAAPGAVGHGVGLMGGLGIDRQLGIDSDVYELDVALAMNEGDGHTIHPGNAVSYGFGAGAVGAAGIFLDEGGADAMTTQVATAPVDPADPRPTTDTAVEVFGHGFGYLGAGVEITGEGATRRTLEVAATAPPVPATGAVFLDPAVPSHALGMSYGVSIGGFGALVDRGGDDSYSAIARTVDANEVMVSDGCACADVTAYAESAPAAVAAHGYGDLSGIGLLKDASGNDLYLAQAESTSEAHYDNGITTPVTEDQIDARATSGDVSSMAQGFGANGGAGFIVDDSGDDRYESLTRTEARSNATRPSGSDARASATARAAASWAQAVGAASFNLGGHGELLDAAGNDLYRSENVSFADANPAYELEFGQTAASIQGSVTDDTTAHFLDAGEGDNDTFQSTPIDSACEGARGGPTWRDCGAGIGVGSNGGLVPVPDASVAPRSVGNTPTSLPTCLHPPRFLPRSDGDPCIPLASSAGPEPDVALGCPDASESRCEVWNDVYRGDEPSDEGFNAVKLSPDGSKAFVTGLTGGRVSPFDYVTIGYDATTGDRMWVSRYDGGGSDGALDAVVAADGQTVFVTGTSAGDTSGTDWMTIAYDTATGDERWQARFDVAGGNDEAWATDLSADGEHLYVVGSATTDGGSDRAIAAFDTDSGDRLWSHTAPNRQCPGSPPGNIETHFDVDASADPTGNERVYVTGHDTDCSQTWELSTSAYGGETGELLWSRSYDGGRGLDIGYTVREGEDGSTVYVSGRSKGLLSLEPGPSTDGLGEDYVTLAYDAATGRQRWVSRYDGSGDDDISWSLDVAPDSSRVFVTGKSEAGPITGMEAATLAYDAATGAPVWTRTFRGRGTNTPVVLSTQGVTLRVHPGGDRLFIVGASSDGALGTYMTTLSYDTATGADRWVAYNDKAAARASLGIDLAIDAVGSRVYSTGFNSTPAKGLDGLTAAYLD